MNRELRRILVIAMLPTFATSIGLGALIPVIPSIVMGLGASLELAAFIAGATVLGTILGDLPAGALVARVGERRSMLVAASGSILGLAGCLLAPGPWALFAGVLAVGAFAATFSLARHAYLTLAVPQRLRARTLSTLGGVFRAGNFIGPLLAAAIIAAFGDPRLVLWAAIAAYALAILVLLLAPDPESMAPQPGSALAASGPASPGDPRSAELLEELEAEEPGGILAEMRRSRAVLLRLGTTVGIVALLRTARQVLLPVWGLSIGLADADIALIVGLSGGIDLALFFTSGWVMDRFGRAASGVPALVGLALGFGILAFTHDLDDRAGWLLAVAIILGLANGLGSGIVMTLGADASPPGNPAPFLAAWHFITDLAAGAVPFLVSGLAAVAGLPAVAATLGGLGVLGAGLMARYAPRYGPSRAERMARAQDG